MSEPPRTAAEEDAQFLRSGVLLNLFGYVFRLCLPALTVFVVRAYGPKLFGVFVVAQLSLQLVFRVGSLGLDRAALWWIARQKDEDRGNHLFAMYFWTTLASLVLALLIGFPGAALLARWSGDAGATVALRSMAAGLIPMALLEMSIHASMGTRDMAVRVFVRDVAVPLIQFGGALALSLLGFQVIGLEVAYLVALTVGALIATYRVRHLIVLPSDKNWWRLPREITRYAMPIWLSELANAVVARLDVYAIAQLMDARAVGIYAAVTQVANSLRSIRQSFDPVVLALCSKIDYRTEPSRFAEGVSRATVAIMAIQLPMWAAVFCFDRYFFMLLGSAFQGGETALLILATCWLLNGIVGLNGIALLGFGRSDLILYDVGVTMASQAALLFWWIPRWGLAGAALAVCVSYLTTNLVQALQARMVSGINPYRRNVGQALVVGVAALSVLLLAWFSMSGMDDPVRRIVPFMLFLAVGASGYFGWVKRAVSA